MLITFEGGEGAGKSTQARLLALRLSATPMEVISVAEPGGTPLCEYLRAWLKTGTETLSAEAELLLFAAARAELVHSVVKPSLSRGAVVIIDRFADSTTAYQGAGRRLPPPTVRAANRTATKGVVPDLTVLLDASTSETLMRASKRPGSLNDRFETENEYFHRRVRSAFRRLAKQHPERWIVLDALESVDVIAGRVWTEVQSRLHEKDFAN